MRLFSSEALIITGSPRADGVTQAMACAFGSLWQEMRPAAPVTFFDTYRPPVRPCVHCGACKKKPACVFDDLEPLDAALKRAGFLVVASPVYGLGFPAPLKALLDRAQRYFEEKFTLGIPQPIPNEKPALFLCACGSKNPKGIAYMEEQLRCTFRLLNARLFRVIAVLDTDHTPPDISGIRRDCARALAEMDIRP